MSRGARLLALLVVAGAIPAAGQDRQALAGEVDRLVHRLDSLHARRGETSLLVTASASGVPPAPAQVDLDQVEVGGLRIRTNRSPLPVAEAAREAWTVLDGYYGTELARLPLRTLTIEGIDPDSTHGELGDLADLVMFWDRPAHTLALALVTGVVPPPDDPALLAWLRGAPAPVASLTLALATVRTQLLLSPFSSGRDCVAGALPSCKAALALLPGAEWPDAAFPLASDRRELVRHLAQNGAGAAQRDATGRCLSAGDDAACSAFVGSLEVGALPSVTPSTTRQTLLAVALARGGPDAYHRLRATAGRPIADRLEAAAGVPVDSLLSEWLGAIDAAARATTPWSAQVGFSGMVWTGLLLFASLWSSRWRAD